MRKGLLIGVGTLGGIGAVLAITPPQFTNSNLASSGSMPANNAANTPAPAASPVETQAAAPAATPTATKKKTATKKATSTKSAATKSTTSSQTQSQTQTQATPAPAQSQAAASSGVNGTFSGNTFQNRFGPVQVQITVVNGKITAAKALQSPNGDFRSSEISRQAIPYLIQETLQAQSANIQGVGGASYTSYGWYQSLQSAIAKAGL